MRVALLHMPLWSWRESIVLISVGVGSHYWKISLFNQGFCDEIDSVAGKVPKRIGGRSSIDRYDLDTANIEGSYFTSTNPRTATYFIHQTSNLSTDDIRNQRNNKGVEINVKDKKIQHTKLQACLAVLLGLQTATFGSGLDAAVEGENDWWMVLEQASQ